MSLFPIRTFGDPVLRQPASPVTSFDDDLRRLAEDMLETMYDAPGVGLAAPQVGIQKRLFVFDVGDGPGTMVNPTLSEHEGEWEYVEGCLSVPELHWPILRPARVRITGWDVEGREVSMVGDDLLGRMFQHEVDHLEGTLLLERLDPAQRKAAMRTLRQRALGLSG